MAADSPRRKAFRGAYEKFSYKSGSAASPKVVEVFLLDERYDRSPLPCHVRRDWCTSEVLPFPDHNRWGWCNDYVNDGNCCSLDEEIALKFCLDPSNAADPLFEQACDARHELWGTQPIKVDRTVAPPALSTDVTFGDRRWNYGFCDVLGEPAKRKCDHK